jgi:glyoxylase-like metal-dependent hydrolase (beta-lactamase superfamily II)
LASRMGRARWRQRRRWWRKERLTGWFQTRVLAPGVFVTLEPAVHPMFRASIVTDPRSRPRPATRFRLRSFSLLLARAAARRAKPVVAVASHAHVDHIGGFA